MSVRELLDQSSRSCAGGRVSDTPTLRTIEMQKFLIAAAMAVCLTPPAHATLNFTFSFVGTPGDGVPGTVTGEIYGLTDNTANQPATDIVITSYPSALTYLPSTPWDIFSVPGMYFDVNSFTVSSGQITAASFLEVWPSNAGLLFLNAEGITGGLETSPIQLSTLDLGDSPVTYTPLTADAPEPASIAVLLSGLFGLGLMRRRAVGQLEGSKTEQNHCASGSAT
jgi:hypothetical protein